MTILQIAVTLYLFHRGLCIQREPAHRRFRSTDNRNKARISLL
jgi:hypothetical protein